jgi:GDP-L-fucose synthase
MPAEVLFSLKGKRVWVAGHRGMVGAALVRRLEQEDCEILTVDRQTVDLTNQEQTSRWISAEKPDAIFLAAAKVGGILANQSYPAEYLYENLMIEANVLEAAYRSSVTKVLFLGSSCIYPKFAPQPMNEEALLTGSLESTNEAYAIAKIAGLKLAAAYRGEFGADFISAMPTNLYGPGDNFDLETSHVLPALIRKAHEAKTRGERTLTIWGTGKVRREFLHVDDCADALVFLMERYSAERHINVGSGGDLTIFALAQVVCEIVGFDGKVVTDESKPDGTPRKLLDTTRLRSLGWQPSISLAEGVAGTVRWYESQTQTSSSLVR